MQYRRDAKAGIKPEKKTVRKRAEHRRTGRADREYDSVWQLTAGRRKAGLMQVCEDISESKSNS